MSTSLSTPEWRFLMIEHLTGKFSSQAEGIRHYFRLGLEASGQTDEVLRCL